MNDIVKEAEEWLAASEGKRSHPAILIKSLAVRIKQLENMLDEANEHVEYLESKINKLS